MAQTTGTGEANTAGTPSVGREGDTCGQCGWPLATDQRYCLNCGWRRGEARVDYERRLSGAQPIANGTASAAAPAPQWTPAFAILAIALLGVMLLLGVLIGKNDNGSTQTVAAQAPATTTTAAAPTDTTPTTASNNNKGNNNKKAAKSASKTASSTAPGQGSVVQGGSGSTQGIQTANTNASEQQNAKNGPDVVATQGPPEKLDPNGQAGGGSSGTCIGC